MAGNRAPENDGFVVEVDEARAARAFAEGADARAADAIGAVRAKLATLERDLVAAESAVAERMHALASELDAARARSEGTERRLAELRRLVRELPE